MCVWGGGQCCRLPGEAFGNMLQEPQNHGASSRILSLRAKKRCGPCSLHKDVLHIFFKHQKLERNEMINCMGMARPWYIGGSEEF